MTARRVAIVSRGSKLALKQTHMMRDLLAVRFPDIEFDVRIVHTTGDRILDAPLSRIGGKGLFTAEIEHELLRGEADLAVHSLKDLPTQVPDGLSIGAVTEREDVRDAWIGRGGLAFADLPKGARIASGSLRRRSQLLALRPDLDIVDIRGNLDTRIRKGKTSEDLFGTVVAMAGVSRMGWLDQITHPFETDQMLPAVSQGAIGIEIREGDARTAAIVATLDHAPTRLATDAERAFLARLEGGCQIPIGAHARVDGDRLVLDGVVASLDGTRIFRGRENGAASEAAGIGRRLADRLVADGAGEVLAEVREQFGDEPIG
ncbi:hydroxymethylbilane synthase [bacterium]|nr:hydroxymethylbilane synthase [bacterium]